jgi:hypothetical protein
VRTWWEQARHWEEVTDRWRFLLAVLPRVRDPRLQKEFATALEQDRGLPDPRGAWIAEIGLAMNERLLGQGDLATRRMSRLERPLRQDLPERGLESWRQLLEDPALASPRDSGQDHWLDRFRALEPPPESETIPDLLIDLERRVVWSRGRELCFRRKSTRLALLSFLARHRPQGFTVAELVEQVWKRVSIPYETDRLVYVGIHRLRQDLGADRWIEEVDGQYRISPEGRVEIVPAST